MSWDADGSDYLLADDPTPHQPRGSGGEIESVKWTKTRAFIAAVVNQVNDYIAHKGATAFVHGIADTSALATNPQIASLQSQIDNLSMANSILVGNEDVVGDDAQFLSAYNKAVAVGLTTPRPALVLNKPSWQFNVPRTISASGIKITGWPTGLGIDELRGSGNNAPTYAKTNCGSTPWLTYAANTYGQFVGNVSFEAMGTSDVFAKTNSPGIFWSLFSNLAFTEYKYVFGDASQSFSITNSWMTGGWYVNNCYGTPFRFGGSDNNLFTEGMAIDTPVSHSGTPSTYGYLMFLDYLEKTTIGQIYLTADTVSGVKVDGGSSTDAALIMDMPRIEGRNGTTQCLGALVWVKGGSITLRDAWLAYAMADPANGSNNTHKGFVHVASGAEAFLQDVTVKHGYQTDDVTPMDLSTPIVYVESGGRAVVTNMKKAHSTDGNAWTANDMPWVEAESGAFVSVDNFTKSFQLPDGFFQSAYINSPSQLLQNTAESALPDNTAISNLGRSGGPPGNRFKNITLNGGTLVVRDVAHGNVMKGDKAYALSPASGASCYAGWAANTAATQAVFRAYFYLTGYPAAANQLIRFMSSVTSTGIGNTRGAVSVNTSGQLAISDSTGAAVGGTTAATGLSLNTWYRIEASCDTVAGDMVVNVYPGDGALDTSRSTSCTGATLGSSGTIGGIIFGRCVNGTGAWATICLDDIAFKDSTLTLLGASA
jgi:hypothetical protein